MALRMPRAQRLLPVLCALAACAATSPEAPTSLADASSGSDPWSQFANNWSPAIQAKINGLKAEVQKANDDADAARTEAQTAKDQEAEEANQLAQAQQQLVEEEPTERNIEARIASALVGWQVAVVFLLCLVACMAVTGHQRGAWTLKFLDPMLKYLDPAFKFIMKYLDPVLKHLDPALKALSPRLKSLGLSEPFLFIGRSDEKLKDPPGSMPAELERARASEATMKRRLGELQAWAEASVAQAQAQEGAAMRALQELQGELQRLRNPMGMPTLGNPMPLGSLGPDLMQRGRSPMPVRPTTPAGRPVKVRAQSPFAAAAAMSPKGTDTPSTLASSPPASTGAPQSFQWNMPATDPWTGPAHPQANAAMLQQPGMLHVNMPNRFHLVAEPNNGFAMGNGQR